MASVRRGIFLSTAERYGLLVTNFATTLITARLLTPSDYGIVVLAMSALSLVDIFRDDPRASLLGTDALRDGVDVPGESLRLVVMERVPWPRPTVLHAARRMAGGGSAYDDRVVRARLAQAFGRLIRRQGDKGLFVILSAAMPSRLLKAFPAGVPIRRVPLDVAIERVRGFLPGDRNNEAIRGPAEREAEAIVRKELD